jgi:hypothetical protein
MHLRVLGAETPKATGSSGFGRLSTPILTWPNRAILPI